jgi:hypothetical protein
MNVSGTLRSVFLFAVAGLMEIGGGYLGCGYGFGTGAGS